MFAWNDEEERFLNAKTSFLIESSTHSFKEGATKLEEFDGVVGEIIAAAVPSSSTRIENVGDATLVLPLTAGSLCVQYTKLRAKTTILMLPRHISR